jgi:prepilin-type N-terminal cleavage/methylation domain-containing protein
MLKKRGFTLIELLVVIAIIVILTAIIFPVFSRAKNAANRSADISRMNQLRAAIQLYKVDQGAFPPALLGYVTLYSAGPQTGNVIPADQLKSYLFPRRVGGIDTFMSKRQQDEMLDITTAVYPPADPRALGTGGEWDLDGDGIVDDPAGARQAYGPGDGEVCRNGFVTSSSLCDMPAEFYLVSGYDVASVEAFGGPRVERRYGLNWTWWGIGLDRESTPGSLGSALDDPHQLGYLDPPGNTVVTWNSFHREYENGNQTKKGVQDIVLFLDGSAKAYDSIKMSTRSWRVQP